MKVRVDMKKLEISVGELFQLDKNLSSRYRTILKRAFEKDTRQDRFTIDRMGCSPELMEELGRDYFCLSKINPFVIVVSPDQADAPLLEPDFSYREAILTEVFDKTNDAIRSVTQKSAMIGEIHNGIDILDSVDDLLRIGEVSLSLDTLDGELGNIIKLNEMHSRLKKNLGDECYVNKMIDLSKDLGGFGDVRRFNIRSRYPVSLKVGSFFTSLLGGVHVLRKSKKVTVVVHDGSHAEGIVGSSALMSRSRGLLDDLFRQKIITYSCSPERIDYAIRGVEDDFLLEKGLDIATDTEEVRIRRKRAIVEKHNELPVAWHELNAVKKRLARGDAVKSRVQKCNFETRIKLAQPNMGGGGAGDSKPPTEYAEIMSVEPSVAQEVVWNLLIELDPACCDYVGMLKYNQQKFTGIFPHFPSLRKKYACQQIANAFRE